MIFFDTSIHALSMLNLVLNENINSLEAMRNILFQRIEPLDSFKSLELTSRMITLDGISFKLHCFSSLLIIEYAFITQCIIFLVTQAPHFKHQFS